MKNTHLLVSVFLMIMVSSYCFAGDFEDGNNAYKLKQFPEAVKFFTKSCNDGNPEGCFKLGFLHVTGEGVKKDQSKTISLYAKACASDHALACSNLGRIYQDGNSIQTFEYYLKAASNGYDFWLKSFFWDVEAKLRDGVKDDQSEIMKIYSQACNDGYFEGCYDIGKIYEDGDIVAEDNVKAIQFYTKACDEKNAEGCFSLGKMYASSKRVEVDEAKSMELYTKACNGGNADGCYSLGLRVYDWQKS